MDEKKRWDDFIKKNPKINIEVQEKYLIKSREVVTSRYLQKIWGVTDKTIRNYVSDGMPVREESSPRFKLFDLIECVSWRMTQIDMGKSNVSGTQKKESNKEEVENLIFEANRDKIIADAKKAKHEASIAEIKEKTALGELISVEDVDKVTAEQAMLHKTDIINSEKILPSELENLSKGEIAKKLREYNQDRLDNLNKLIQKDFDCDETLYEIVKEVLKELNDNSPKQIINKIKS